MLARLDSATAGKLVLVTLGFVYLLATPFGFFWLGLRGYLPGPNPFFEFGGLLLTIPTALASLGLIGVVGLLLSLIFIALPEVVVIALLIKLRARPWARRLALLYSANWILGIALFLFIALMFLGCDSGC